MGERHAGTITAGELAKVCSHYDLGHITRVQKFAGGSRSSPKVLLVSGTSAYLLKRRAPGAASDPRTVALTHEIILHLEQRGIPAPELVGTRKDNNSMLQLGPVTGDGRSRALLTEGPETHLNSARAAPGKVYEVYRFVQGRSYGRTEDDARSAGEMLARMHAELVNFKSQWPIPQGSFHAHPAVVPTLHRLAAQTPDAAFAQVSTALAEQYKQASRAASEAGIEAWPIQLVHSDWHPGNILFSPHDSSVAAILDFDSSRLAPALLDAANGAMQFSMGKKRLSGNADGGGDDLSISLNPDLFRAFWAGYNSIVHPQTGASTAESRTRARAAAPWLMIQALIVEALVPIVATGRFNEFEAPTLLKTVQRATGAIATNAERLASLAGST